MQLKVLSVPVRQSVVLAVYVLLLLPRDGCPSIETHREKRYFQVFQLCFCNSFLSLAVQLVLAHIVPHRALGITRQAQYLQQNRQLSGLRTRSNISATNLVHCLVASST